MPFARSIILLQVSFALMLVFAAPMSQAVVDIRDFPSEQQRQRYQTLIAELRCPKCQNQSLAGSDSPIAKDLRRELHRLLLEGKDDKAVKDYMVARYGDYVLYRPRLQENTLMLWFAPLAIAVIALLAVVLILRRQRPVVVGADKVNKEKLKQLLAESEGSAESERDGEQGR